jgi:hypothetical protein
MLTLLRLAEEFDVLVVRTALGEQAGLADEDVGVAEAVTALGGVGAEGAAQAAELFQKAADEWKPTLGVDAFVSQCKCAHVAPCRVGFITAPFTSSEAGCHAFALL